MLFADSAGSGTFRFFKPGVGAGETLSASLPERAVDGGLAAVSIGNGQTGVFYLAGGTADQNGVGGNSTEFNRLYYGVFNFNGAQPSLVSEFQLLGDLNVNDFNGQTGPGPVFSGLGVLDQHLYTVQRRYNGALASQPDQPSYIVSLSSGKGVSFDQFAEIPTADLQSITGAQDRGSLFVAGSVSPEFDSSSPYKNLALFEIDPRTTTPLIKNTLWGAVGDFDAGTNTTVGNGFDPNVHNRVAKVGGLSYDAVNGLVINAFASTANTDGHGTNAFFLKINPDFTQPSARGGTRGTTVSSVIELSGGGTLNTIGVSSIKQGDGASAPVPTLVDPGDTGRDFSIGFAFGNLAYSSRALQSGVIQQVFRQRFIETAQDPIFCSIDPVIQQIPGALNNNVNKTSGIARTTFDLRHPLPADHPCQSPAMRP